MPDRCNRDRRCSLPLNLPHLRFAHPADGLDGGPAAGPSPGAAHFNQFFLIEKTEKYRVQKVL